jgi:hypothetical protein
MFFAAHAVCLPAGANIVMAIVASVIVVPTTFATTSMGILHCSVLFVSAYTKRFGIVKGWRAALHNEIL